MPLDRQDVERRWSESIYAGSLKTSQPLTGAEARAKARRTADALPGLFRADTIEVQPCL
jgi:hypothetical protein